MRFGAVVLVLLVSAGCSGEGDSGPSATRTAAVLYSVGLSTDPYGESNPRGFGVATGLVDAKLDKVEVREPGLGGFRGAEWLDSRLILVPRGAPPLRKPLIYRYEGGLKVEREAPIPGGANYFWSPSAGLFAYESIMPCSPGQRSTFACFRATGELYVVARDGSRRRRVMRGHLLGWTAGGMLAFFRSYGRATTEAVDVATGKTGSILPTWKGALPLPVWSSDRRFFAAISGGGVLVAHGDGRVVQRIRTKLMVSMIAWSPAGNRLAFTTSGFPDPHQLFVLDGPGAKARLLYATGDMHFDWITWSPGGTWLLLDEEHRNRWLLLRTDRTGERLTLPRLGGRPLWCCPVNAFQGS